MCRLVVQQKPRVYVDTCSRSLDSIRNCVTSLENRTTDVQGKTYAFHSTLSGVRNRFACARRAFVSIRRERERERERMRRKSLLLSSLESNLSEMVVEKKKRYREKLSRSIFDEHHLERLLCYFAAKKEARMKDVHPLLDRKLRSSFRSLEKSCLIDG